MLNSHSRYSILETETEVAPTLYLVKMREHRMLRDHDLNYSKSEQKKEYKPWMRYTQIKCLVAKKQQRGGMPLMLLLNKMALPSRLIWNLGMDGLRLPAIMIFLRMWRVYLKPKWHNLSSDFTADIGFHVRMVVMHHGFLHLYCFEELDFNIIEITVPENLGVYIETNLPGELFGCDVMNN